MATKKTALTLALGSAIAASLAAAPVSAGENPFAAQSMEKGYMVAEANKAKEGNCGGMKGKEGSCGGKAKGDAVKAEKGKTTAEKGKEGNCGGMKGKEGNCGGKAKAKEGKKAAADAEANKKMIKEGKCGEGKCGGMK